MNAPYRQQPVACQCYGIFNGGFGPRSCRVVLAAAAAAVHSVMAAASDSCLRCIICCKNEHIPSEQQVQQIKGREQGAECWTPGGNKHSGACLQVECDVQSIPEGDEGQGDHRRGGLGAHHLGHSAAGGAAANAPSRLAGQPCRCTNLSATGC